MDTDSIYIKKKYIERLKDCKSFDGNPLITPPGAKDRLGTFKNDFGEDALIVEAIYAGKKMKGMVILSEINRQFTIIN